MLPFISVTDVSRLINERGLATVIRELSRYIEADYLRWDKFNKCERTANHAPTGVIELMPIDDGEYFSFKYVNGHPPNTANGMLTVAAFGVLSHMSTGYPLLLSELTLTTALRTAATSALAAQVQARADCTTMALIGNGAQSEFQAIAFRDMMGIKKLRLYDVDAAATQKLVINLAATDIDMTVCQSVADATYEADIITTVTADKALATIITPEMVAPGTHINAVGGDCPGKTEIHIDVVKGARVMVEYEPQTRAEGEIQQLSVDSPVIHFAEVLAGKLQGRTSTMQVTLFDSVGFAIEDFSSLKYLRDVIPRPGQSLDLIPMLVDPKDLYALVRSISSPSRVG
jgi:ornithine cyclodeaminase